MKKKNKIVFVIICLLSPLIGEWLGVVYEWINYKIGILSMPYGEYYSVLSTIAIIFAAVLYNIPFDKKNN